LSQRSSDGYLARVGYNFIRIASGRKIVQPGVSSYESCPFVGNCEDMILQYEPFHFFNSFLGLLAQYFA
jgi:hypothetical protein